MRKFVLFFCFFFFFYFVLGINSQVSNSDYFVDLGYSKENSYLLNELPISDRIELYKCYPYKSNALITQLILDGTYSHHDSIFLERCQNTWPFYHYSESEAKALLKISSLENFDRIFTLPLSVEEIAQLPFQEDMFAYSKVYFYENPSENQYIPVLMYHMLDNPYAWISLNDFQYQLQTLYDNGYTTLSFSDFLAMDFSSIPLRRKPIILTFDDGWSSQFHMLPDGTIDPECGVWVLENFHKNHPLFGKEAIFFINFYHPPFSTYRNDPFSVDLKLKKLVELGYEIGNHTYYHGFLSNQNETYIHKDLNLWYKTFTQHLPLHLPGSNILCYPGGEAPDNIEFITDYSFEDLKIIAGCTAWGGVSYFPNNPHFNAFSISRTDATNYNINQIIGLDNIYCKNYQYEFTLPNFVNPCPARSTTP